jgi:hypothetical protein
LASRTCHCGSRAELLLARDAREAAAELQRRGERWGVSSVTASWPSIDAMHAARNAMP